ncbi:MAG: D-glycero-beta-D-manno-heptose 1-phosphate adenylyltransferase [bacterium]
MTLLSREEAVERRTALRQSEADVVFTNGCFDLIHPGHVHLLKEARSRGGYLIVGLNSDRSVKAIKSNNRPIMEETDRAYVINALESVDDVVLFDEETPLELIQALEPDVLVKGADYEVEEIVGADVVLDSGGEVHRVELREGYGTSEIINVILSGEIDGYSHHRRRYLCYSRSLGFHTVSGQGDSGD